MAKKGKGGKKAVAGGAAGGSHPIDELMTMLSSTGKEASRVEKETVVLLVCLKCGTRNPGEANYCMKCGQKLK